MVLAERRCANSHPAYIPQGFPSKDLGDALPQPLSHRRQPVFPIADAGKHCLCKNFPPGIRQGEGGLCTASIHTDHIFHFPTSQAISP